MLYGPSQIINPLAASRSFGYGTGAAGGGPSAPAPLTADTTIYTADSTLLTADATEN